MRKNLLLVMAALWLLSAACFLFPAEEEELQAGGSDRPTDLPTLPPPALSLRLPGGATVHAAVVQCNLAGRGEDFTLHALEGAGADRLEVRLQAFYLGAGVHDNISVSIGLGPEFEPIFAGESLNASATINEDGSGSFDRLLLANTAGSSPFFEYGQEYSFEGEWTCIP